MWLGRGCSLLSHGAPPTLTQLPGILVRLLLSALVHLLDTAELSSWEQLLLTFLGLAVWFFRFLSFFLILINCYKPHITKLTILTKSTVKGHEINSHCCIAITTVLLQDFFILQNWNSVPIKQLSSAPSHWQPPLLSLWIFLGTSSCKWNHSVFVLLRLAYFA